MTLGLFKLYFNMWVVLLSLAEKLVEAWQEAGLSLSHTAAAACTFCDRPLHFDLMNEWEKSYFGHMEPRYITVSA